MHDDRLRFGHLTDRKTGLLFAEPVVVQISVRHAVRAPHEAPVVMNIAAVIFTRKAGGGFDVTVEWARQANLFRFRKMSRCARISGSKQAM